MPFTKFTDLDFDQIKTSIKSYLRANSDFTGFDFEGSNFSVLIDTLAYNTYITAFNSNMVVNESFLDSATMRENVVSLARNIGYVPRSKTAATANVTVTVGLGETDPQTSTITLDAGLVCVGNTNDTSFVFSVVEAQKATVSLNANSNYEATFNNIDIKEGIFLEKNFQVDGSLDQRFILDNEGIDTSTIKVYVSDSQSTLGTEYAHVDNILNVTSSSLIYLLQEVQDERYELFFGDGYFGKKIPNNYYITVRYIVTDGKQGNGIGKNNTFAFSGNITDDSGIAETLADIQTSLSKKE